MGLVDVDGAEGEGVTDGFERGCSGLVDVGGGVVDAVWRGVVRL